MRPLPFLISLPLVECGWMGDAALVIDRMKCIATFPSVEDAHLFRAFLASRGVEAVLLDEYVSQTSWHYTQALGGVRLVVAEEDEEVALGFYQEYMAALRSGPYPEEPVRAWPLVLIASLLVGLPFLLLGRHRKGEAPP